MSGEEARVERIKLRLQIQEAQAKGTPRYRRAHHLAHTMLENLRDFVAPDHDLQTRLYEFLLEGAFQSNSALINVPPEYDEFDKQRIEQAMLDRVMQPFQITPEKK